MGALSVADKLEIQELLHRSAWAYDEARLDVMEAGYVEDAEMRLRIADGDVIGPHEGRDAVIALNRGAIESQTDQRRHVISNVFFEEEEEDRAVVVSSLTLLGTPPGGETTVLSAGLYRDTVVRRGGRWYFQARFLTLDRPY